MTRAITLTAFRNAAPAADIGQASPTAAALRQDDGGRAPHPGENLRLTIYSDLHAVEAEWRRFESEADCTAFQTFEWLSAWQRTIGQRDGVVPAIAVGSGTDGGTAFIWPLAVEPGRLARRLCWLGQGECDYNAPLQARDFAERVPHERFLTLWAELRRRLQCDPLWRHDWIELEKMPRHIGAALNPFVQLDVVLNPSGAHLMHLGADWETFYVAKRSSATRRRDRIKRKNMSAAGEVRFVTAANCADAAHTLKMLMEQKSRALLRRGITDMFARPGHREFYLDLASNPATRQLVHVSRIEVGSSCVAANLGVIFRDCYYHVLACYNEDSELARYGPGALHLRELLAYAIGRGLKCFDFTIGDEPYKREWSDCDPPLYDFTAAATWRGLPARWLSLPRRRIKRFIKQTPWAWRMMYHARAAFGRLLHRR